MTTAIRVSKDLVNWDKVSDEWISENEIPGDPLEDTAPENNDLSIFILEDLNMGHRKVSCGIHYHSS